MFDEIQWQRHGTRDTRKEQRNVNECLLVKLLLILLTVQQL